MKVDTARAVLIEIFREFDPGSGRTLAACLTHASRTECCAEIESSLLQEISCNT